MSANSKDVRKQQVKEQLKQVKDKANSLVKILLKASKSRSSNPDTERKASNEEIRGALVRWLALTKAHSVRRRLVLDEMHRKDVAGVDMDAPNRRELIDKIDAAHAKAVVGANAHLTVLAQIVSEVQNISGKFSEPMKKGFKKPKDKWQIRDQLKELLNTHGSNVALSPLERATVKRLINRYLDSVDGKDVGVGPDDEQVYTQNQRNLVAVQNNPTDPSVQPGSAADLSVGMGLEYGEAPIFTAQEIKMLDDLGGQDFEISDSAAADRALPVGKGDTKYDHEQDRLMNAGMNSSNASTTDRKRSSQAQMQQAQKPDLSSPSKIPTYTPGQTGRRQSQTIPNKPPESPRTPSHIPTLRGRRIPDSPRGTIRLDRTADSKLSREMRDAETQTDLEQQSSAPSTPAPLKRTRSLPDQRQPGSQTRLGGSLRPLNDDRNIDSDNEDEQNPLPGLNAGAVNRNPKGHSSLSLDDNLFDPRVNNLQLKAENNTLARKVKELQALLDKYTGIQDSRIDLFEKDIKSHLDDNSALRAKILGLQQARDADRKERASITNEKEDFQEEIDLLRSQLEQSQEENARMRAGRGQSENVEIENLTALVSNLQTGNQALVERVNALLKEVTKAKTSRSQIEQQRDEAVDESADYKRRLDQAGALLRNMVASRREEMQNLQADLVQIAEDRDLAQNDRDHMEEQRDSAIRNLNQERRELHEVEHERDNLRHDFDQLNLQLSDTQSRHDAAMVLVADDLAHVTVERNTAREEVTQLTAQLHTANAEVDRINPLLVAANAEVARITPLLVAANAEVARITPLLVAANAEVARITPLLAAANAEVNRITPLLATADAEVIRLNNEVNRITPLLATANAEVLRLNNEVNRITPLLAAEQARTHALTNQVNALNADLKTAHDRFLAERQTHVITQRNLNTANASLATSSKSLSTKTAGYDKLLTQYNALAVDYKKVQDVLAAKNAQITGMSISSNAGAAPSATAGSTADEIDPETGLTYKAALKRVRGR